MKVELLKEPKIEFANQLLSTEPKQGIATSGFYSKTNFTHRSEIHFGVIGTKQNVEDLLEWINSLSKNIEPTGKEVKISSNASIDKEGEVNLFSGLESEENLEILDEDVKRIVINKKLNPTFPGFRKETCFNCEFQNNPDNNSFVKKNEIDKIFKSQLSKIEKADSIITLYHLAFKAMLENSISIPDVCFIPIPSKVFKLLGSIPSGNKFVNFRRKLKASLLGVKNSIPVQLILEDTIKENKKSLQDKSMIAWNFCVAQYYKVNGIPWSLTEIDMNTCFIGISFHKIVDSDDNSMRASVAQAFNKNGRGLIFVGEKFKWDSAITKNSAPHLTHDYAKSLISKVLEKYIAFNNNMFPSRVVIHKTTDFWDSIRHKDYAEVEGLKIGIKEVIGDSVEIDLVTIKSSTGKLLRTQGKYPVLRGTLLKIDDVTGILYSTGYVPFYETYPGLYAPHPLSIDIYEGESTLKKVCKEILALSKMNFNNCDYYGSLPITLTFSKKVGEIIGYLPNDVEAPDKYYYYM